MTLWDRIEQWRSATKAISAEGIERPLDWEGKDILRMCADDLEADLRELRAVVERVPHIRWVAGHCGDMPACPRCALEARIGGEK